MTVKINDKWRIATDKLNYMPEYYDEGGQEVRVVGTDKTMTKEPRWVRIGRYYGTFAQALRGIVEYESHELAEEEVSVDEYLERLESISKELYSSVQNGGK